MATEKSLANLRPFRKGDTRINRKGRPKTFDAARELAQQIAHQAAVDGDGRPIVHDGHVMTVIEQILRRWATSGDGVMERAFVEYAIGKPPQTVDAHVTEERVMIVIDR